MKPISWLVLLILALTPAASSAEAKPYEAKFGYELSVRAGASPSNSSYYPGRFKVSTKLENGADLNFSDNLYFQRGISAGIDSHNLQLKYKQDLKPGMGLTSSAGLQTYQDNFNPANYNNNFNLSTAVNHKLDKATNLTYKASLGQRKYPNKSASDYERQVLSVRGTRQLTPKIDKVGFDASYTNNTAATATNAYANLELRSNYDRVLSKSSNLNVALSFNNRNAPFSSSSSYQKTILGVGYSHKFEGHRRLNTKVSYASDNYRQASNSSNLLNLSANWQQKLMQMLNLDLKTALLMRNYSSSSNSNYNRLDIDAIWNYFPQPGTQWVINSGYTMAPYRTTSRSYNTLKLGFNWLTPMWPKWISRLSEASNFSTFPNNSTNNLSRHTLKWQLTYNAWKFLKPSINSGIELLNYQFSSSTKSNYNALSFGLNLEYKIIKDTGIVFSTRYRTANYADNAAQNFSTFYTQGGLNYVF